MVVPIFQTTTYRQPSIEGASEPSYSRAANPTVSALEAALGSLEEAPAAVACASGMAALSTLVLATTRAGDHVIVSEVAYGGTVRLFREVLADFGLHVTFVDTASEDALARAILPSTRLVLVETPANPTLRLTDVAAVARTVREATGGRARVAVDNTFLTSLGCRPLELGADVSVYSTTKYHDGHDATVGGAIVARDEALLERLRRVRKTLGTIQSPFDAWLTLQGIKTLPLRLRRQCETAERVARWLAADPRVTRVMHPGLPDFPQAELARRQHRAGLNGAIVAFECASGASGARRLAAAVEIASLAENLGAVETLVTHPVSMTHGDVPREQRLAAGITDGLVRLSVGVEDPDDLIADLNFALDAATAGSNDAAAGSLGAVAAAEAVAEGGAR